MNLATSSYLPRRGFWTIVALALCAVAGVFTPSPLQAQEDKPGSTHMFVTYRSEPANRPAFIKALRTEGVQRFETLKRNGVIRDYLLVYNEVVDANTWDALAIVQFERYDQTAKWREMELESPGALTPALLMLGRPHTTYYADLVFANGSRGDQRNAHYMVIPYEYRNKGEYTSYIGNYGVKQFDGWIREGAISSYGIFLNQHATGAPWDALLLFEYNGIDGLARREVVKQKVRRDLASDPEWKKLSDGKADIRRELEVVITRVAMPVSGN